MNDKKIRKLVLAALLAALVCVATMVVQIPSPMQGYVNLGDCFVLLSGWLLGPWYGFAASARCWQTFSSAMRTTLRAPWSSRA
jgi:uncharacterized membrane protein